MLMPTAERVCRPSLSTPVSPDVESVAVHCRASASLQCSPVHLPRTALCVSARRGCVRHRVLARLPDARAPQPTPERGAGRRRGSAGDAPAAACGLSSSLPIGAGAARRRRLGGGGAGAAPPDEGTSE
eukprot:gene285-biopygen1544